MNYKPSNWLFDADNNIQMCMLWIEKENIKAEELKEIYEILLEARKNIMSAKSKYHRWAGVPIEKADPGIQQLEEKESV
jgi:hypothetical protein